MPINPKGIAIVITKKKPSRSYSADEEEAREMDDEMDDAEDDDSDLSEIELSPEFKAASDEMYNAIRAEDRDAFGRALKSAIIVCQEEES